MGHSSSCRVVYTKISSRAREGTHTISCIPTAGKFNSGTTCTHTRKTHFVDKLILLLGVLKFIFCNGRFHVEDKTEVVESKGNVSKRGAHGRIGFLTPIADSRSINLWQTN